jgi:hypothetical protein
MIVQPPATQRQLLTIQLTCDLAVIGGGLAGVCAGISAARAGVKVVLIQDRPVLGGNASSEVRLWTLGATSHMGNNNRWAREGGVIDEIFVENTYRNPEGNPLLFDAVLLEKVTGEANITLLLNTAVFEVAKWLGHPAQDSVPDKKHPWAGSPSHPDMIKSVRAYCSQNETLYEISAPLFCDASGDGVEEKLELVPPLNFWSLCPFGGADYDYKRDAFALPKEPPPQIQLGEDCRAMVFGWKLRPGVALKEVTLETLSQEVVIGLMGASVMNPK